MPEQASIGVTGLAVMGQNLARNFAREGYAVAVHNRTLSRVHDFLSEHGAEGSFIAAESLAELVSALERPRRILVMVKAGDATDVVLDELADLVEPGDVLVDGGNAHFEDTRRRSERMGEHGIHFVGTGISGGEEGALHGPSLMPGGSGEAYAALGPMLERISAHVDGLACCAHVGPDGAGHFVKLVHNGIEYADMQLIAESYDVLRHVAGFGPDEIAEILRRWNAGRLESYLIEITAEVLRHTDTTTGRPFVDVVLDQAEQKGTGRWTVQIALDLGIPVPNIAEAVFARSLSGHQDLRESVRPALGGPRAQNRSRDADADLTEDVAQALYASKLVAYAQGWNLIAAGSREYGWDIDLGQIATIWRGGCIIRAAFLDRIRDAYSGAPRLPNLLADPGFARELDAAQPAWRRVLATATAEGIPTPGFSAALAYYDALRAERLPSALIQAQRDFFGAHSYRRVDSEGTFHTRWGQDRREEST